MTQRDGAAGVTLVEMLVALVLFALVGLASFTTLDAIIRVRDRTEGRLEQIARIDRALLLFSRDAMQATGVEGDAGSLVLTRVAGPGLNWDVVENTLVRTAAPRDGTEGVTQTVLPRIEGAGFRFLDATGAWSDVWPPETEASHLRAVELRVDFGDGMGEVVRLAEGPDPIPVEEELFPLFGGPDPDVTDTTSGTEGEGQ